MQLILVIVDFEPESFQTILGEILYCSTISWSHLSNFILFVIASGGAIHQKFGEICSSGGAICLFCTTVTQRYTIGSDHVNLVLRAFLDIFLHQQLAQTL